jgi:hypothetical protein
MGRTAGAAITSSIAVSLGTAAYSMCSMFHQAAKVAAMTVNLVAHLRIAHKLTLAGLAGHDTVDLVGLRSVQAPRQRTGAPKGGCCGGRAAKIACTGRCGLCGCRVMQVLGSVSWLRRYLAEPDTWFGLAVGV